MAFELPPLPYAYEALNDTIDTNHARGYPGGP